MKTLTEKILQRLKEADGYVSGEDMSRELNVSRTAISNHVQRLRGIGYAIESSPRRGHLLRGGINQARPAEVQPLLTTVDLGRHFVFKEEIASSNRLAMTLAADGAPDGTVVVAEKQTAGRGRMDRSWHSPTGLNLYVSLILRPEVPPIRGPELSLVTAISLRESLQLQFPSVPFRIKWPNDIWVEGRKLAGVLCEMSAELDRIRHLVVGVGINVNATESDLPVTLRDHATSVRMQVGEIVSRPRLLADFLNRLEPDYHVWQHAADLGPFLDVWHKHCILVGRRLVLDYLGERIHGIGRGIDRNGRLLVEQPDATLVHIPSGDVHIAGGSPLPLEPRPQDGHALS